MTSKSSFLISMKENMRRRMWYPLLLLLIQVFEYPVAVALALSNNSYSQIPPRENGDLISVFHSLNRLLGVASGPMLLAIFFGVLAAIQGFSYLNSRKKVDLYHSVPVSKNRRFWVIVINSFSMYAVIHLGCVLAGIGIAALYHCMNVQFFAWAMMDVAFNLIAFLTGFCVTLVAVMLTGNTVVTLLGAAVLAGYELLMRTLIQGYFTTFFEHYSYMTHSEFSATDLWISPIITWGSFVEEASWVGAASLLQNGAVAAIAEHTSWSALPRTLIQIVIFMAIGYALYRKRGSEAAGKAIAFSAIKQPLKVLLLIPISMTFGAVFSSMSNSPTAFEIFGLIVGLILGHCMIEMIYEFDLKAPLHRLLSLGVASLLTAVILMFFMLDPMGYDRYVPNPEKVEYAGLYLDQMQHGCFVTLDAEKITDLNYISEEKWVLERMRCSDTALVCRLAENGMRSRKESDGRHLTSGTIHYKMKNGKDVYRQILLDLEEDYELLDAVLHDEGYLADAYQLNEPEFEKLVDNMTWYYENASRIYEDSRMDVRQIYETYRNEFNARSLDIMCKEVPIGELTFRLEVKSSDHSNVSYDWSYPVYPSFNGTIDLLKLHDMEAEGSIRPESVKELVVEGPSINLDELADEERGNYDYAWGEWSYTRDEDIQQIMGCLYPRNLIQWVIQAQYSNFDARVYFGNKDIDNRYDYQYMVFLKGNVPDIVLENLTVE